MCHTFLVVTVKKWLRSVYIYGSYRKISTVLSLFLDHSVGLKQLTGVTHYYTAVTHGFIPRDAMHSAVLVIVNLSVCLSVRPSDCLTLVDCAHVVRRFLHRIAAP